MDKYQTAMLNAFKQICIEAEAYPESVNLIPKFGQDVARLKEIVDRIDKLVVGQITDLKGITVLKKETAKELIGYAKDIAGAMHSYAQEKDDMELLEVVNFPVSSWSRMNDHELFTSAGIILDEVKNIPEGALAELGISVEYIQQFGEIHINYDKLRTAWREAVIDRSGHTAKIRELLREAYTLVKGSLDKLATQYKRKDPDFYLKYKSSRHIIYRRKRRRGE